MQSQSNRRRNIIILIVLAIVATLTLITLAYRQHPNKLGDDKPYVDPWTHQVVSSPSGKSSDIYGQPNDVPIFLGIDKLLSYGLSFDQINLIKQSFYQYSKEQSPKIKEISIDVDHIMATRDSGRFYVNFRVKFNRSAIYKSKIDYTGLESVRLYLMDDKSGVVVYDSKDITGQVAE